LNFRNILRNKRGIALKDISTIAIMVVVAGIVIGIGSEVLEDVKTTATCGSSGITDESIAFLDAEINYSFTGIPGDEELTTCGGASALVNVRNSSYSIFIGTNFTYNGTHITKTNDTAGGVVPGTYQISYNFSKWSAAQLVSRNASEGIGELAKWTPTIMLVVAAALIIGIIFTSFMRGRV